MELEKLKCQLNVHPPLGDQVYSILKDAILSGTFEPGERLIEKQTAVALGLSRVPVREAFRRLEQDGYLTRTKPGMVVRSLSFQELQDLYQVRARLEGMAAANAAERAGEQDVARLRRILQDCADLIARDNQERLTQASFDFHSQLYSLLGNRFLIDFLTRLMEQLRRYRSTELKIPHRGQVSLDEDWLILDAIARHDAEAADRFAQEHINHLWEHAQAHAARLLPRVTI